MRVELYGVEALGFVLSNLTLHDGMESDHHFVNVEVAELLLRRRYLQLGCTFFLLEFLLHLSLVLLLLQCLLLLKKCLFVLLDFALDFLVLVLILLGPFINLLPGLPHFIQLKIGLSRLHRLFGLLLGLPLRHSSLHNVVQVIITHGLAARSNTAHESR